MQAACNNYCVRRAAVAFVLIEWNSGMGDFWGESHFRVMAGKGETRCGEFIGMQKMPTEKQAGNGLPSKHRYISI